MKRVFVQEIRRRNPFRVERVPWLARVYAYPFERYESLGRQALFGAPNFLFFLFAQKFLPIEPKGEFCLQTQGTEKAIQFNGKNTQFSALYLRRFFQGYEPQITALIDLLALEDSVFYDIGSNWGWFSLFLASKPGFRGRIHAFEPFETSYRDLTSVVNQAGFSDVIRCHNVALSDKAGTARMHLPDRFQSGQATMEEGAGGVQTVSLDSLQLEPPTLMKMDVEGAEMKVLRGGAELLRKNKPLIFFENSRKFDQPMQTLEPLTHLRELGYCFFHVAWLRKSGATEYFIGEDADPNPQATETLALLEFAPEERFLRPDGMNVFACPTDRLDILTAKLRPRT